MTQSAALAACVAIAFGFAIFSLPMLDIGKGTWVSRLGIAFLILAGLLIAPALVHVWIVAVLG